jgi:cytochrome c553
MKPISIRSSANKALLGLALVLGLAAAGAPALAGVSAVPGEAIPFEGTATFQETIEARCTICHTRERVDEAMRAQRELEPLIQHMLERGAILSERDRKVLGTFWGSPMKGENPSPAKPR